MPDPTTSSTEKRAPVQGYSAGIPWSMHLRAYDAYCKKYGPQQALIEGWCRGGFGTGELDIFIPGWREELSEITQLRASLREMRELLKDFRNSEFHGVACAESDCSLYSDDMRCDLCKRTDAVLEATK